MTLATIAAMSTSQQARNENAKNMFAIRGAIADASRDDDAREADANCKQLVVAGPACIIRGSILQKLCIVSNGCGDIVGVDYSHAIPQRREKLMRLGVHLATNRSSIMKVMRQLASLYLEI